MAKQTWLYFGCVDRPGHHLRDEQLRPTYQKQYDKLGHFDGLLPPRDSVKPYIATFSRLGGWGLSAIAFWDYSVDSRGGCNSVFYVDSLTIDPHDMMKEIKQRFSTLFERFPSEVVFHPSVETVK